MHSAIEQAPFAQLPDGSQVSVFTLKNSAGMTVRILDFGGIITEIHVPDRDGAFADVALGFDTLEPYRGDSPYFGALIGRYGNRIAGGRFTLDGQAYTLPVNNGKNHLHGGVPGFDRVLWRSRVEGNELVLDYRSLDGEQGYPGTVDATVRYSLDEDNGISVRFSAVTDRATPVNLTQHSYFNLAGGGDILGHVLTIDADNIVPIDADLIPTGALGPVAGTPFDFRTPVAIGARIDQADQQLAHGGGYDHCFALNKPAAGSMSRAARVRDPVSGRVLELFTQEPGVQFYSGNFLGDSVKGKGRIYGHRSAFCLEPQHFPDSPNRPAYPSTILRPGEEYTTVMAYKFTTE